MEHSELVRLAEQWLLKTRKCSFVFTELVSFQTSEIPDAIGFTSGAGFSILIECKVSRSDFLADAKKVFRQDSLKGMGNFRFFLCPEGIIQPEDLPPKWGLIWIVKGKPRQIIGPKGNAWGYSGHDFFFEEKNILGEWGLMASALRRLHLRGALPLIYDNPAAPPQAEAGLS